MKVPNAPPGATVFLFIAMLVTACDDATDMNEIRINIGDTVLAGPASAFILEDRMKGRESLKLDFLRISRLTTPEGAPLPKLPTGRREKGITDHGALTLRAQNPAVPGRDTGARLAAAVRSGHAELSSEGADGFSTYRLRDSIGVGTAYSPNPDMPLILGKPFTIICADGSLSPGSEGTARLCDLGVVISAGTFANYAFYDDVWRVRDWPVLALVLDHTLNELVTGDSNVK